VTKPLAYSLADMRRAVEARLGEHKHNYYYFVQTAWLRGHEHAVMEIKIFPTAMSPPDYAELDDAEQVLAALPNVYRLARITNGTFGRARDLRAQVRVLVAMHSVALEQKPLGGGWATLPDA
jgi:hypothetical protein